MEDRKFHVLIAEDDKDDTYFIKSAFEESGRFKRIDIVENGVQLFQFLANNPETFPDVIITDLNMPKMDGFEVLERISKEKEYSKIPVIVLSTSDNDQAKEKCMELGARIYLVKPFDLSELNLIPHKVVEELE